MKPLQERLGDASRALAEHHRTRRHERQEAALRRIAELIAADAETPIGPEETTELAKLLQRFSFSSNTVALVQQHLAAHANQETSK